MCNVVVLKDPFMLIDCSNRYKTQKMCDQAVDDCLAALKFILDWFVTSKILEKLYSSLIKILVKLHILLIKWVLLV